MLKRILSCVLLGASLAVAPAAEIIRNDYAKLDWKSEDGSGKIEMIDGKPIAVIDIPKGSESGQHWLVAPIKLEPYMTDQRFGMSIRARWSNVSRPPQRWNGIKFMLNYTDSHGNRRWFHPQGLWGDRDWIEISTMMKPLTKGDRDGRFILGLENCSGRVEFDLDSMKTFTLFNPDERINLDFKVTYPERLAKDAPRRGVMSPHTMTEEDFKTLRSWNVNLLRYQIMRNWGKVGTELDLTEYERWLNGKLDHLEQILGWAKTYGIKVVIDLHTPPGGSSDGTNMLMFSDKRYTDHFIDSWKRIATRFKGNEAVWGYDLINEPNQTLPAPYDYWTIQKMAAEAVREIDQATPIIMESNESDSPSSFAYLSPLAMDNVVYQVHMYMPMAFTHQSVATPQPLVTYPGVIEGIEWNKEKIREMLRPVREFQLRHNARIYAGEFSAVIWAPGAERYLSDCIEIFEEYGWDWTYHAFREWNGWSLEHEGKDRGSMRSSPDNPRKQIMLKAFEKNKSSVL